MIPMMNQLMNQQLLITKQRIETTNKDKMMWRKARSIITDVVVQVGALIDGVCTDFREASGDTLTIRFSWAESASAAVRQGLVRIAMLPADGIVKINALSLDSPDKKLVFERALSMWELDRQKLGQALMDAHAWTIKKLTPGLCKMMPCESPAEAEDPIWSRGKWLAVTQPSELSVQI